MGLFRPDSPEKAAEKAAKLAAQIIPSAQEAWASGQRYFTPVFVQSAGINTGANSVMNYREWPILLDAVESVGWRLHTWQTVTVMPWNGPTALGSVAAHPLFVR